MNLRQHGTSLRNRNVISVEKQLLRAEREIIDRAQQCAVIKESGADANYSLAGLEGIVSERQARSEVIAIAHDAFVFPTQSITNEQVRNNSPVILCKNACINIVLG